MISEKIAMQKAVADKCLSMIELIDPTAIVAGGAPRDWYFGKEASDIDIFFYFRADLNIPTIEYQLERVGFCNFKSLGKRELETDDSQYSKNPNLRYAWQAEIDGEVVQLILMNAPTFLSAVPKFPLNICRIWYKRSEINLTQDFKRAVKWKAIVKCDNLYADSDRYLEKIKSKFPEYDFYSSYEHLAQGLLNVD